MCCGIPPKTIKPLPFITVTSTIVFMLLSLPAGAVTPTIDIPGPSTSYVTPGVSVEYFMDIENPGGGAESFNVGVILPTQPPRGFSAYITSPAEGFQPAPGESATAKIMVNTPQNPNLDPYEYTLTLYAYDTSNPAHRAEVNKIIIFTAPTTTTTTTIGPYGFTTTTTTTTTVGPYGFTTTTSIDPYGFTTTTSIGPYGVTTTTVGPYGMGAPAASQKEEPRKIRVSATATIIVLSIGAAALTLAKKISH